MNYTIVFFIMITMFIGYVAFIWLKYGVQPSISESYYRLPEKLQWAFTIAMWGYAIPAIIIGVPYSGLAFLAGAAICFVGASPLFKMGGSETTVHMTGAVVGVTASQLFILFVLGQWWNVAWFILAAGPLYLTKETEKTRAWWVEIFAFLSLAISYAYILF